MLLHLMQPDLLKSLRQFFKTYVQISPDKFIHLAILFDQPDNADFLVPYPVRSFHDGQPSGVLMFLMCVIQLRHLRQILRQ